MTENLAIWLHEGKNKGAIHLVVFLDTSNNTFFPVYVMPHESLNQKRKEVEIDSRAFVGDYKI